MDSPSAPSWIRDAICWQVYPLGSAGAPGDREPIAGSASSAGDDRGGPSRLARLHGWLDHLVSLGANVLLLNPVFDSVSHGYDTLDHHRVDPRLGDDEDLDALITACRERGIRVVLDGVFNHLSDRHPLVREAIAAGPDSPQGRRIRWADTHPYGFEGNADLVELDLAEPSVQDEIAQIMISWLDRGVDGWRLDAMYAAGAEAWQPILEQVRAAHPEAWLLGEVIHGDYPAFAAGSGAHSITQYELWKAIWSALHDRNLFELAHALGRHKAFLEAPGGARPLTFLGNHDTTRIASQLADGRDLAAAYALLALLPGIPALYAGDEFGAVGVKEDRPGGDDAVRPELPASPETAVEELSVLSPEAAPRILEVHRRLFSLRRRKPWLAEAGVHVDESTLSNTWAQITLRPRGAEGGEGSDVETGESPNVETGDPHGEGAAPLLLVLNLGDEDRPAPGEVLEAVSGADMLDSVGPAPAGMVPAHGAAAVR